MRACLNRSVSPEACNTLPQSTLTHVSSVCDPLLFHAWTGISSVGLTGWGCFPLSPEQAKLEEIAYRTLSTLGPAAPRTAQPTGAALALMAGSLLALSWAHLPSLLLPLKPPAQMLQVELLLLLINTLCSS